MKNGSRSNAKFHHRSSLKQANKPFKGGSRSKSRGRTETKKTKPARPLKPALNRTDRRNQSLLLQKQKREEALKERRIFSGREGAPRVMALIPATVHADVNGLLSVLVHSGNQISDRVSYSERNKQKLMWIDCPRKEGSSLSLWTMACAAAASAADTVVFVVSALDLQIDDASKAVLAVLRGQGISSAAVVLQHAGHSAAQEARKDVWLDSVQKEMGLADKIYSQDLFDGTHELAELERRFSQKKVSGISWRDNRPYLVVEDAQVAEADNGDEPLLVLSGYMRGGKAFSANCLVHIPGLGTFPLSKIEEIRFGMDLDGEQCRLIQVADPQESHSPSFDSMLVDEAFVSDGDPSAEEMIKPEKRRITVPKGTSSYQAAWFLDAERESALPSESDRESNVEDIIADADDADDIYDTDEAATVASETEKRRHFPDEVDVPNDIPARERFQRYRGVQSLRASNWDPFENLPPEYSRIFQFKDFGLSQKRALEESDSPFSVGSHVSLYILGVPSTNIIKSLKHTAVFGLHRNEEKMSLVNFTVNVLRDEAKGLNSKEDLVACFGGFRRFNVKPIFSEHGDSKLHKMLRTVEPGQVAVGSVYAPIHYQPCPVLLFRRDPRTGEAAELVAMGSVLSVNPRRIVVKRITLTASPFRVNKRAVVARFMFYQPKDIEWFRPVELVTKSGRRGHIKESLGTHGYMKCLFDRPINPNEKIAMHLYKRVYPKWTTTEYQFICCSSL